MFIIDKILVTVSSFLLNTLVVNKFILFHELSRSWKKQLWDTVHDNKPQCWCITNVDLLKTMYNTQTIFVLVWTLILRFTKRYGSLTITENHNTAYVFINCYAYKSIITMWKHITLYYITLQYMCYTTLYYTTAYYIILYYTILYYANLSYTMLYHTILYYTIL